MPTKVKKTDETAALAEAMLRTLASLQQQGGEAYPPSLRQLAELTGGSPTDEQVQTAANKKTFTNAADVTEKVGRLPSLESPVYLKGDAPAKPRPTTKRTPAARPPKDDGAELAGRMLLVLESQRRLGPEAYPLPLRRLAELCDKNASDAQVTKAANHKGLTDQAIIAGKPQRGKPQLDAPVILKTDIDADLSLVLPALLRFALRTVTSTSKGKTIETTAFTPAEIRTRFVAGLEKPVVEGLERAIEQRDLPDDIAWVLTKGKPYLFLVGNLPSGTRQVVHAAVNGTPTPDFAARFREAFDQLNRLNHSTNFVKLADLRRELSGFNRESFDVGLRKLRENGEFSLDSHEGLHGSLSEDEREAGVRESGSLLIYVSRR